jgi:IS5 family transposase
MEAAAGEARTREPSLASGTTPLSPAQRCAARLAAQLDRFLPLVEQAIHQAQRRVLDGQPVASREKVLSLFEPHTLVVHRGKTGAAVEFGRQARLR